MPINVKAMKSVADCSNVFWRRCGKNTNAPGTAPVALRHQSASTADGFRCLTPRRELKSMCTSVVVSGGVPTSNISGIRRSIWNGWAEQWRFGPVYGKQWRSWPARTDRSIDQDLQRNRMIRRTPASRRIIVSGEIGRCRRCRPRWLAAGHAVSSSTSRRQNYVISSKQRSADRVSPALT